VKLLGTLLVSCALLFGAAAFAQDVPDVQASMAKLSQLIGRLQAQAPSSEFAAVANELGPVIDELRAANLTREQLVDLRQRVDGMAQSAEQRLTQLEADTTEDEGALEALYRSRTWDDMSFALGAFPYWRAWLDLEIARFEPDKGLRIKALLPAQNGFKRASMQLFRPGLVYGGWLGLGYVELEQGRRERARQIFRKLDEVLAAEPDSPVKDAVAMELRMLEAKEGGIALSRRSAGGVVDANEVTILKAEIFALLQQSRKTGGRALEAAKRIRTIIEAGRMDQGLLTDMLGYAQELAGVDIGAYTYLAGAEFAMQYEHWYNAMQKYESFFKEVDPPLGLNLDNYRYRWALAAYKSAIYEPAIGILNKLVGRKDLAQDLDEASAKLLYAIHAARERKSSTSSGRQALRVAAERFVARSPHDPAADAARLVIAQTANSAATALNQMHNMASAEMRQEVGRTAFQIIARDFSATVARGKTGAGAGLARQGIAAWDKLPKEDQQDPFNFALLLEMRALVDENPEAVLKSLDQIEQKGNLSLDIQRALVWSRLQLYDRMSNAALAVAYVERLAASGIPTWQLEYLYPWIRERKDGDERLHLARVVRPAVKTQPDMDRRFAILIIEGMLEKKQAPAALEEARAFVKQYPKSGDAWKLLARSSEAAELPFEADRAWRVITDKAVPTMPIWWEGMLSRVRIRSAANRPDEACPLIAETVKHQQYLPADFKQRFATARAGASCDVARSDP